MEIDCASRGLASVFTSDASLALATYFHLSVLPFAHCNAADNENYGLFAEYQDLILRKY